MWWLPKACGRLMLSPEMALRYVRRLRKPTTDDLQKQSLHRKRLGNKTWGKHRENDDFIGFQWGYTGDLWYMHIKMIQYLGVKWDLFTFKKRDLTWFNQRCFMERWCVWKWLVKLTLIYGQRSRENDDYAVDLQETLLLVGAKTLLYPADLTQKIICKRMLNDVHLPKTSYPSPLAHWQILKPEMSDQCDLHNEKGEHGDLDCETVDLTHQSQGLWRHVWSK